MKDLGPNLPLGLTLLSTKEYRPLPYPHLGAY